MLNKTHSLKHFVYLVGLHIYYKMIHGPYSIKVLPSSFPIRNQQATQVLAVKLQYIMIYRLLWQILKFRPRTSHEGSEVEYRYSSTLSLTSTLDGDGQRRFPAALTTGRDAGAGWATGPVWTDAENLALTGIRSLDRPSRRQSLFRLRYLNKSQQMLTWF